MVAEQVGDFAEQPRKVVPQPPGTTPSLGRDRHYGEVQDPLDIAELSGLSESQVRVVIKRLERQKEIPEKAGIVRKRPDGRKTIHYREPVLGKILSAIELMATESGTEE